MKKIAVLPIKDREALFRNTSNKMGMTEAIIEKDFWVCWMLDYLFHRCQWKDNLAFKGGTSLSKAYGLIQRFSDTSILQEIRLEIGALAAWTPAKKYAITPYVAQQYGHLFEQPSTEILTVLPERTFWEKVTILHREAFRPVDKEFPLRYSRHYYDLYCMAQSKVIRNALTEVELLNRVVEFKDKFYRCPWARYDLADFGTMQLMPPEYNMSKLREDYAHMQNMIFGKKPDFEEIMSGIKVLESKINHIAAYNI